MPEISFFNPKAKISFQKEIKQTRDWLIAFIITTTLLVTSWIYVFSHHITTDYIIIFLIIFSIPGLIYAYGIYPMFDTLRKLLLDRNAQPLSLTGTIAKLDHNDSRYTLFRYHFRFKNNPHKFWIDKPIFQVLKNDDTLKISYVPHTHIVKSWEKRNIQLSS